jgi:hypothetical protein
LEICGSAKLSTMVAILAQVIPEVLWWLTDQLVTIESKSVLWASERQLVQLVHLQSMWELNSQKSEAGSLNWAASKRFL